MGKGSKQGDIRGHNPSKLAEGCVSNWGGVPFVTSQRATCQDCVFLQESDCLKMVHRYSLTKSLINYDFKLADIMRWNLSKRLKLGYLFLICIHICGFCFSHCVLFTTAALLSAVIPPQKGAQRSVVWKLVTVIFIATEAISPRSLTASSLAFWLFSPLLAFVVDGQDVAAEMKIHK